MKEKIYSTLVLGIAEIVIIVACCFMPSHIYDIFTSSCSNDSAWIEYSTGAILSVMWVIGVVDAIVLPGAILNIWDE